MAGQGVNLGFGDVALLRDLLVSVVYEGKDVGRSTLVFFMGKFPVLRHANILGILFLFDQCVVRKHLEYKNLIDHIVYTG